MKIWRYLEGLCNGVVVIALLGIPIMVNGFAADLSQLARYIFFGIGGGLELIAAISLISWIRDRKIERK